MGCVGIHSTRRASIVVLARLGPWSMESELIAYLRERLPAHPLLTLGAGDDAAVLRLGSAADTVVTVDMLMDGIDFELPAVDPRRVGHKSLAVNLSDLAAMASRPVAAVIALALPRRGGMQLARQLYEGLLPLAERYAVAIAGGDTNSWDGPLVVSITALGTLTPRGPLRRGGARPGDRIVVTGAFGGSILGKHLDFEPRVGEALLLHERYELHAGIDASDGLSLDLAHVAQESGCGALIEPQRVPIADAARQLAAAGGDGATPLDHALGDGEDFELILAVPPEEARRMLAEQPLSVPLTAIGRFVDELGLWQAGPQGRIERLVPRGYQHEID
jgi:thiamine-monophosphate kinase